MLGSRADLWNASGVQFSNRKVCLCVCACMCGWGETAWVGEVNSASISVSSRFICTICIFNNSKGNCLSY